MRAPTKPCRITIYACAGRQYAAHLRRYLPAAIRIVRSPLTELSVVLVNDETIARLHADHFADPATTDVITFPLDMNARGKAITGELYLCVPMAQRQARLRGVAVRDELLLYAIHGVLHLSGHDDTTSRGYTRMHRKEDQILRLLGVGAIFARSPQKPRGS